MSLLLLWWLRRKTGPSGNVKAARTRPRRYRYDCSTLNAACNRGAATTGLNRYSDPAARSLASHNVVTATPSTIFYEVTMRFT